MNNGILVQDVYGKTGFDNKMPRGIVGIPMPISVPYHFPPNYDWKNNIQQFLILVYDTTKQNNTTISIPYGVQTFVTDISIDWGDGTTEKIIWSDGGNSRSTFHTYSSHGVYTVKVSGRLGRLGRANPILLPSLIKCYSFGDLGLLSIATSFGNCPNLIEAPASLPSGITSLASTFLSCPIFNDEKIKYWNTTNITAMNSIFQSASAFNQDIGAWNVSSVTDMNGMFGNALAFNNNGSADINNWNTSNVTNMSSMFFNASSFNQPVNNWNVRKVTTFASMFQGATSFNSSLSGWALGADTAGTSCLSMFQSATSFNQDISNWDTSKVTNMGNMFANQSTGSGFNQNIGSWNTSSVTNMSLMFYANYFFNNNNNNSINSWNTANVTDMNLMFFSAISFNQPIGNWNVSKVTNMTSMFTSAFAFNQDISNWNLAGLNASARLDNFMNGKTGANSYSTANYDALLIGWNNNKLVGANGIANWRTDLKPNFGGAKYTAGGAAATARAALVSYGWTITDGGTA